MAKVVADTKKGKVVIQTPLMATGRWEEHMRSQSAMVAEYLMANGGVSNPNQGKGGDQKGKRVEHAVFIAECGKVIARKDANIQVHARLHKKVCPICSLLPDLGTKCTSVHADCIGDGKILLDVSGSVLRLSLIHI